VAGIVTVLLEAVRVRGASVINSAGEVVVQEPKIMAPSNNARIGPMKYGWRSFIGAVFSSFLILVVNSNREQT
jgi:hypothetical protein